MGAAHTHKLRMLVGAGAATALFALLALMAYGIVHVAAISGRVDRNQRADTSALCALRADLQQRVSLGRAFLAKHPRGLPGLPAATLRVGIANEQATVLSLQRLACASERADR